MATELENLVPEADVEIEGMRGPKGDKGDSYVLTEADKEEIAQKVDKIIDAETDKTLTLSGKPADAKAAGDEINSLKADLNSIEQVLDYEIIRSKNLLNTNADGWEDGAVTSTGTISTTGYEGNVTSPYIPVTSGESIISTRVATADSRMAMNLTAVGYYKADQSFISKSTGVSTFSAPENTAFIRVSGVATYLQTSAATYKPMLNYGTTVDTYEAYFDPYSKSEWMDDIESDITALDERIDDIDDPTTYVSENLLNPAKFNTVGQYYASDSGAAGGHSSDSAYISYDDLIEVEPSTSYVFTKDGSVQMFVTLVMVNTAGTGMVGGGYSQAGIFTTTADTKYVRISITAGQLSGNSLMLAKGDAASPYKPWFEPYTVGIRQEVDALLEATPMASGSITCWGDSFTYGTGGTTGHKYTDVLHSLTGLPINKCGFPGDKSNDIVGYNGSMPLVCAPVTIPASGSVNIDIYTYDRDDSDTPFKYPSIDAPNINPVVIGGIEGNLDLSASANHNSGTRTFAFTRSESGEAVQLLDYTNIYTSASKNRREDIQVVWIGSNGGWNMSNDTLISQIKNMVEYQNLSLKKYIIVGIAIGISITYAERLEPAMQLAFGNHYINMRDYLIRCGLAENNITPTAQDEQDIADGKVPTSLKYTDGVHLNDYGYNSVAQAIYRRGKELGYWS